MDNLLLIEDNPADARLVEEYLSETSTNGDGAVLRREGRLQSGLRRLDEEAPDCILLDLDLPDSHGLASVERVVRASGDTPVIVLTGLDDEETALRAVQAGADDYLRKDELTPTSLRRAVRHARERRRLQEAVREEARRLEEALEACPAAIASTRGAEHVLRSGRTVEDVEIGVRGPDGEDLVLSVNASPLSSTGEQDRGVVLSLRDVTERKQFEEQLRHRALHDPLTGLPNRALFRDRLDHVLSSVSRTGDGVAVFFLDIDRFKVINDSLGHEAGDRLLERIARRLRESVRDADTVARMGGDEFMILLEEAEDGTVVESVAERIVDALDAPFVLGEREVHVEMSMGIAVHDGATSAHGLSDADALTRRADEAMYRAKESAGTTYRLASCGDQSGVASQLKLETRLRRALERGAVETAYQPIFDLGSRRITGLEALARWDDPELGRVSPGRFIPLAEETGLITELGRQQLRRACRQVAEWKSDGEVAPDLRLHVNLSMGQLDEPGFVDQLRGVLDDTGFAVDQLWLEITESVTMRQPERLSELSTLGARLTVDDFGTRYSTLAQLKRLDLDALKIDRTFVDGLADDSRDRAIVDSVITLGQSLGLEVVAEGIETEGQLEVLEDLGCDSGQGFVVGRPVPGPEAVELIRKLNPASGSDPARPA